jgi:hypothetical protein
MHTKLSRHPANAGWGTPGETYLSHVRKIDTGAIGDVLGRVDAISWHAAVLYREEGHALHDKRIGAIVAIMTDAVTGKPTGGVSRTYVHQGRKVAKAKGLGPPSLGEITLYAFNLCGIRPSALTPDRMETARTAANLIQAEWAARGVNLWQVQLVTIPLVQGTTRAIRSIRIS